MKKNKKKFIASTAGRLDQILTTELKISRSQVQKLIEQNLVLVNDRLPKKAGEQVKDGDKIEIALSPNNEATEQLNNGKGDKKEIAKYRNNEIKNVKIIAEAPDYIVVEKPSGMLTHPTQANETNTLVNFLIKKYPEIKKVHDSDSKSKIINHKSKIIRPGIVHRLDKEASGLLVVARTQKMFNHLKDQFKNRTVEKEYWALVHGKVAKDWDEITFPIARAERSDRMAARPLLASKNVGSRQYTAEENAPDDEISISKEAKTEFLVEKRFANCTLLRVILHTGRMHQIRVHMLAYNHPLVGDPLYFQKKRKRNLDERLGRLFLHSAKLSFNDLTGNRRTFESGLPPQLKNFLASLK